MLGVGSDFYAGTDQGRQRRGNEDAHFARRPLFAVADGMGGAQAGEIASSIAVDIFQDGLPDTPDSCEERLASLVQEANARIHEHSRDDEQRAGMGTTLTAAYLDEDELAIAHVGDSRLYLLRGGVFERLTRDHSLVEELVQEGRLTPEEADEHPQRSIITRALGPEPQVLVDHFTRRVQVGDIYLICSDGLTAMVKDDQKLGELVVGSATLREAGQTLIDAANAAGGRDNITVVLFRIVEIASPEDTTPPSSAEHTMVGRGAPTAEAVRGGVSAAAVQDAPAARRVPRVPETSAPAKRPRRRRARRVLRGLVVSALVVLPILAGAWIASQSVYFVGTDDQGFLTLYRGMPYELPGGASLYNVNYTSGVPVAILTPKVKTTIAAHKLRSRDDASDLVRQIELGRLVGQGG